MNVFITGFERSGTTLLRRIVSMWPGFHMDLIHEEKKLFTYKTAQEAENNYFNEYSHIKCGEKVPYYGNTHFIVNYISKFREFWPDSMIFHMLRTPEQVIKSCKRTFMRPTNLTEKVYNNDLLIMTNYLREEPNCIGINYDNLIQNPKEMVKLIYERLGSVPGDDVIEKIISTKDPWELNGKRMCGLRYSDRVGRIKH